MRLKFKNTEITLSYTLICVAALCIIMGEFEKYLFCVVAVILHETGHLIPMKFFGKMPDKIKIMLFEIYISDRFREKRTRKQNIIIILFGPFVNFICFILFFLIYLVCGGAFFNLAIANLSVGLFNIMPVITLDGGQLLFLILTQRLTEESAQRVVNIITFIFIFPLFVLGFVLLFYSKYNFSLLFICIYLILSLLCKNNRYY